MYQLVNLSDLTLVGAPTAVPSNLAGLTDASLADLSAAINPPPQGFAGRGFWPVVVATPPYDPVQQVLVDPTAYAADRASRTVTGQTTVRDMSVTEFATAHPDMVSVSRWRFYQQLAEAGLVTQQEALDASGGGAIPAAMGTIVNQLPANQQFAARMLLASAPTFDITHPFVPVFQQAEGLTDAQIIALWRAMVAL